MKTTKIRKSARGEKCLARVPGYCNANPETVVLAHRNGGGMGMKRPDWQGAYCCSECHAFFDGGWVRSHYTKAEMEVMFNEAIFRTQQKLMDKGLITVTEHKPANDDFEQQWLASLG